MRDQARTYGRSFRSLAAILVTGVGLVLPSAAAANHQFTGKWDTAGSGPGELATPTGIDTDSLDNVYVADWGNNRIQKFSPDGDFMAQWGTFGNGDLQFDQPVDVAVDGSGNVYVADRANDRVQMFNSSGVFQ